MRFQVSEQLAGKTARCKRCGNSLRIPEPRVALSSVAASGLFRLCTVQPDPVAAGQATSSASAEPASLRLAPIPSLDNAQPIRRTNAGAWEEEGESTEYKVDWAAELPVKKQPLPSPRRVLRRGGIAETALLVLQKFSDFGYLISIVFLLVVLLGIILKQRELATIAAIVVVLCNVVRLTLDGFVLATLAFKKGVMPGVLFFIPPFTFYFASHSKVLRDALRRFLAPALPIAFLILLFVLVPWLRGVETSEGDLAAPAVTPQQEAQTP